MHMNAEMSTAEIARLLAEGKCPACSRTGEVPPGSERAKPGSSRCCACGGNGQVPDTTLKDWLFYVRCCKGGEALGRYLDKAGKRRRRRLMRGFAVR